MRRDDGMAAKRAHGAGSVTEYKDGFRLRWSTPDGGRGTKVMRGVTRKLAEAELRRILAELAQGTFHDDRKGNVRFDAFVRDWLEWKEPQVRYSTFKNYGPLLKTTSLPTFGAKKLNQITERMVDVWWARHANKPVNRRNAYFLLRGILQQAKKWGLIAFVPVDIKDAGADVAKTRPDWSLADFDAVHVHVHVPEFYQPALEIMFAATSAWVS
jgi:hypothetical protein